MCLSVLLKHVNLKSIWFVRQYVFIVGLRAFSNSCVRATSDDYAPRPQVSYICLDHIAYKNVLDSSYMDTHVAHWLKHSLSIRLLVFMYDKYFFNVILWVEHIQLEINFFDTDFRKMFPLNSLYFEKTLYMLYAKTILYTRVTIIPGKI